MSSLRESGSGIDPGAYKPYLIDREKILDLELVPEIICRVGRDNIDGSSSFLCKVYIAGMIARPLISVEFIRFVPIRPYFYGRARVVPSLSEA